MVSKIRREGGFLGEVPRFKAKKRAHVNVLFTQAS